MRNSTLPTMASSARGERSRGPRPSMVLGLLGVLSVVGLSGACAVFDGDSASADQNKVSGNEKRTGGGGNGEGNNQARLLVIVHAADGTSGAAEAAMAGALAQLKFPPEGPMRRYRSVFKTTSDPYEHFGFTARVLTPSDSPIYVKSPYGSGEFSIAPAGQGCASPGTAFYGPVGPEADRDLNDNDGRAFAATLAPAFEALFFNEANSSEFGGFLWPYAVARAATTLVPMSYPDAKTTTRLRFWDALASYSNENPTEWVQKLQSDAYWKAALRLFSKRTALPQLIEDHQEILLDGKRIETNAYNQIKAYERKARSYEPSRLDGPAAPYLLFHSTCVNYLKEARFLKKDVLADEKIKADWKTCDELLSIAPKPICFDVTGYLDCRAFSQSNDRATCADLYCTSPPAPR